MTLTQAFTWSLTTFVMVYLPRYVGDVGLGKLTLAGSFAALASLFMVLGTSNVIIRDVARARDRADDYVTAVILQRLLLGVLAGLATALLVRVFDYPGETRLLIYLSIGLAVVGAVSGGIGDVLRGQENFPRQNLAAVLEKLVTTLAVLMAIWQKAPLWAVVACGGAGAPVGIIASLSAFRAGFALPEARHRALGRQIVVAGMPFFANGAFVVLYSQCYPIILQRLSGEAAVGWYGLVTRLFGAALFIPTILSGAMLPALSRLLAENPAAFPQAVRRMVLFTLVCVAPIAAVIIFMPAHIIRLLHYPPSFSNAIPVFVFFGIGLVLWFLSISVGTTITALGLQREFARASVAAAAAVIPLAVACVWITQSYLHNGAIGAAISHVLIEFFLLWRYLRALPSDLLQAQWLRRYLVAVCAAALPMGMLVLLSRGTLGLFALVPGFALYVLLCWRMRCITPEDLLALRAAFARRSTAA